METETKSKMDFLRGMTESGCSVIALGGRCTGGDLERVQGQGTCRGGSSCNFRGRKTELVHYRKAQRKPFSKEGGVKSLMCQKMSRRMEVEKKII